MPDLSADLHLLRAAGTALLLDTSLDGAPVVLHWGADPGDLDDVALRGMAEALVRPVGRSQLDLPMRPSLLPSEADGWSGRPALTGAAPGGNQPLRLRRTGFTRTAREDGGTDVDVELADDEVGVRVTQQLRLEPSGVVRLRHVVTATSAAGFSPQGALAMLPVPMLATEVLDCTGRWTRERTPQRGPLLHGQHARENRRGRTGHDATTMLVAGTAGFGWRTGQVWGAHVAWSGDQVHVVDRVPEGHTLLGGGELLRAGEVQLAEGESYTAPWTVLVWSDEGLDGVSARVHDLLRARPGHPSSPRPVVLNTWEAVYFDHDLDRLTELARVAASVGVERFVLDDGWFGSRRDDTSGLGDWTVSPEMWPDGLNPLFDRVRDLGMQVGLWVEPEMVNLDSDLVRAHPDWLLSAPDRLPLVWRNQHVLDVARPEASAHLLERLSALVSELGIDFLKWDMNRDLHEAAHPGPDGRYRPGVHAQTTAVYRLLAALRERHPGLEIESCASGGARIDLGVLEHTDRVWASDTNDAIERQGIQRWTGLILPPELIGSHVGPEQAHTTERSVHLSTRLLTSLFAHAGFEWDVTRCSADELDRLRAWTALYKEMRPLLHGGRTVRTDLPDPGALLHGVVAHDRSEGVYAWVRTATAPVTVDAPITLPGLDPDRAYRVRVRHELDDPGLLDGLQHTPPPWTAHADGVVLPGAVLAVTGLAVPVLPPATGLLLHVTESTPNG
ncbi:alpha-galactosidase [Angustibacter aerolatus]